MANTELAKKIKAAITAKPEFWDQHKWASVSIGAVDSLPAEFEEGEGLELTCGTTMCLAGWACHLSGEKIDWTATEEQGDQFVAHRLKNGQAIEDRAVELLEIDWDSAGDLFYAYDEEVALDRLTQLIEDGEIHNLDRDHTNEF
jgi:hypothetical protein